MFLSRISAKIAFWYSVAFLISALLLFALTALLLINSLQKKDRELLFEKLNEYSSLYTRDGVSGLQLRITSREIKHASDFVVRLSDKFGKTMYIHSPDRSSDDNALQLADLDRLLLDVKDGWIVLHGDDFGDDVEVVTKTLPGGERLQVGKDTEDREAFVQSFTQAYFQGLVPLLVLAIVVGALLSNRMLQPIRWLTQTVEKIRAGNPSARVPLRQNKDELYELGHLFNQMLEQNERLVQGMLDTVDNVAHDLRTPVMRLQNSVEHALRGTPELVTFQDALVDCKDNSDLILRMLNGIMDISEAEAGTLHLKKELLSANQVIDGAIDLYSFVAEEKMIRLVSDCSQDFKFVGDLMRVLQVVANLIDNAIKYSPGGTKVVVQAVVENGWGSIRVSDEGPGIDSKDLLRIWDRLYRVDSSRSTRGLGLGLSLVKAVVQAHDGSVGVVPNAPNRGTTFVVRFKIT